MTIAVRRAKFHKTLILIGAPWKHPPTDESDMFFARCRRTRVEVSASDKQAHRYGNKGRIVVSDQNFTIQSLEGRGILSLNV